MRFDNFCYCQYKLAIYSAMQHHSFVSSISSKEIDLARSRSGLFFVCAVFDIGPIVEVAKIG
jgi:hypothetical protein